MPNSTRFLLCLASRVLSFLGLAHKVSVRSQGDWSDPREGVSGISTSRGIQDTGPSQTSSGLV